MGLQRLGSPEDARAEFSPLFFFVGHAVESTHLSEGDFGSVKKTRLLVTWLLVFRRGGLSILPVSIDGIQAKRGSEL